MWNTVNKEREKNKNIPELNINLNCPLRHSYNLQYLLMRAGFEVFSAVGNTRIGTSLMCGLPTFSRQVERYVQVVLSVRSQVKTITQFDNSLSSPNRLSGNPVCTCDSKFSKPFWTDCQLDCKQIEYHTTMSPVRVNRTARLFQTSIFVVKSEINGQMAF